MELVHQLGVKGTVKNASGAPLAATISVVCFPTKKKKKRKTTEKQGFNETENRQERKETREETKKRRQRKEEMRERKGGGGRGETAKGKLVKDSRND